MRTSHLRRIGLLGVLAAATAGSGCSTMNNTEKGAVGGGVIGTGAGAAIGAATGRPLLGAAIGGLGGTAVGALVGNDVDKEEKHRREIAQAAAVADAQAQSQRLGVADVMALAKAGHSDQVIINQIRTTRSTFNLVPSDLDMLKANGVSQVVIAEMQAARAAPGQVIIRDNGPVIYDSPPPVYVRPAPVVVVGPPRPYGYYGYGYRRGW